METTTKIIDMPEEDISSVDLKLTEILKNFGLNEDEEESFRKIESDEILNGEIASEVCAKLAKDTISEPEAIVLLKKIPSVNDEIANKILKNVKLIVLPELQKIFLKRGISPHAKAKPQESLTPPSRTYRKLNNKSNASVLPKNTLPRQNTSQNKNTQDNYREPIE